jgi:hypothetical protein
MSMKKKLGSKLSEGVRQVKSQREPVPAPAPAKTTPAAKPAAKTMPASPAVKPVSPATKPVTPRVATQAETNLNKLHPRRVWPD